MTRTASFLAGRSGVPTKMSRHVGLGITESFRARQILALGKGRGASPDALWYDALADLM